MRYFVSLLILAAAFSAGAFAQADYPFLPQSDSSRKSASNDAARASLFCSIFDAVYFSSPQSALASYVGNWAGMQSVCVGEREIAQAVVEQHFVPSSSDPERLIGTGKIVGMGMSIPIRCFMFIENGKIRQNIQTEDGRIVPYVGVLDGNAVSWVPLYFMMQYDVQTDTFSKTEKGIRMDSLGEKYVKIPSSGEDCYLIVKCSMNLDDDSYSLDKVRGTKSIKFNFPSAELKN